MCLVCYIDMSFSVLSLISAKLTNFAGKIRDCLNLYESDITTGRIPHGIQSTVCHKHSPPAQRHGTEHRTVNLSDNKRRDEAVIHTDWSHHSGVSAHIVIVAALCGYVRRPAPQPLRTRCRHVLHPYRSHMARIYRQLRRHARSRLGDRHRVVHLPSRGVACGTACRRRQERPRSVDIPGWRQRRHGHRPIARSADCAPPRSSCGAMVCRGGYNGCSNSYAGRALV